jgi:hypothetical protein
VAVPEKEGRQLWRPSTSELWPPAILGAGGFKGSAGGPARRLTDRRAYVRQRSGLSLVPLNMKMGAISMDEQMTLRIFGWVVGTVVGGLFVLSAIALALL